MNQQKHPRWRGLPGDRSRRSAVSLPFAVALASTFVARAAIAAQGFGADTPGGAGKPVYRVTTLADTGPGSLRDAVSQGNRTILFDRAGSIDLDSNVAVRGAFLTIDGLSAPSPGITLRNAGLYLSGSGVHDVIVRGIRVRDPGRNGTGDGITIKEGAYRVLVDHVSLDGCGDGNIDVTKGAHDVTIAWSVLSGCAKNVLIKYEAQRVTLHHNVLVHSQWRNPWISNLNEGTIAPDTTADLRNNLIWGWGSDGGGTGVECGAKANVVNNYYSSPKTTRERQEKALMVNDCDSGSGGLAYASGNVSGDDLAFDLDRAGNRSSAFPAAFVDTHEPCIAAADALAGAGVDPLDDVDLGHLSSITLPACDGERATPTASPAPTARPTPKPEPTPAATPLPGRLLQLLLSSDRADSEEKRTGDVAIAHELLEVGRGQLVALRFSDVTIPKRARILSAILEVYAAGRPDDPVDLRYTGEHVPRSKPFRKARRELSRRRRTKAYVDDAPGGWRRERHNQSPDLKAIVQEIVNQSGWSRGNPLTIFVTDRRSDSYRKVAAHDKGEQKAARLIVRYQAAGQS